MIVVPWIVFFAAVLWMISRGVKAKQAYFLRRREEEIKEVVESTWPSPLSEQKHSVGDQSRTAAATDALQGGSQGKEKWN